MSFITDIFFKMMTFFMSLFTIFGTGENEPVTDDTIAALDAENLKVSAVLWADSQVSDYMYARAVAFEAACKDVANSEENIDALFIVGDITENSHTIEKDLVLDCLSVIDNVDIMLFASGNHDIRMQAYSLALKSFEEFCAAANDGKNYTNGKMYYSYDINGYKFIVLGSDNAAFEEASISEEQLVWLDSELRVATAEGKPAFVFAHQPLAYTHGLPTTWGSGNNKTAGSIGKVSDDIKAILSKYENVFFITGHLHTGFGQYIYEEIDTIHGVNLPSIGIKGADGLNIPAGMMLEIYEDKVVFRARDFAKGKYITEANGYDVSDEYCIREYEIK